jgi:hypothetical protein
MARDLAERRGDKAPEEVFIAALLSSIGEIAFCCVAENQTEAILRFQTENRCSLESAQREVLGFTFDELSVVLTSDLKIGDLVKKCARATSKDNDPRVKEINLSKMISVDCTANPHDEETRKLVTELSSYLKLDKRKTWDIILKQSEVVHETVSEYGAQEIIEYLPMLSQDEHAEENKAVVREDLPEYPEENSAIQLGILKDLSEALETSVNLNGILQIVLEGINRGVGMDRVLFALLSPDRPNRRKRSI